MAKWRGYGEGVVNDSIRVITPSRTISKNVKKKLAPPLALGRMQQFAA
jgi:hypothetical protein